MQELMLFADPALCFVTLQTGLEGGPGEAGPGIRINSVAPNPATAATTVSVSNPGIGNTELLLLDLAGRVVRRQTLEDCQGSAQVNLLDDSGAPLPSGCYLLRLSDGTSSDTSRLVILR